MDKKPVLITGTSTGIGRACALHLARTGFQVFTGVRKQADAESLVNENIPGIEPLNIDVTDSSSIAEAVKILSSETGGKLFALVNNAGTTDVGPVEFLRIESIRNVLNVNVAGMMDVIKNFLPLLRRGNGRIVNIGSISGLVALPGLAVYAASKYGVEALSDALRLEVKNQGISVSLVEPGNTETPIFNKSRSYFEASLNKSGEIDIYGWLFDAVRRALNDPKNQPVEKVVAKVDHALTAKKPKKRYRVGSDAALFNIIRKFPTGMRDIIISKVYGI